MGGCFSCFCSKRVALNAEPPPGEKTLTEKSNLPPSASPSLPQPPPSLLAVTPHPSNKRQIKSTYAPPSRAMKARPAKPAKKRSKPDNPTDYSSVAKSISDSNNASQSNPAASTNNGGSCYTGGGGGGYSGGYSGGDSGGDCGGDSGGGDSGGGWDSD